MTPILLGILTLSFPADTQAEPLSLFALTAGALGICGTYRWLSRPEHFKPTIENLNVISAKRAPARSHTDETPSMSISKTIKLLNKDKLPERLRVTADESLSSPAILVEQGVNIDKEPVVFIFSRGYARTKKPGTNGDFVQKGAGIVAAHIQITSNIINDAPCISFDYPDRRRTFNFAQETDVACLATVYQAVREKNPDAQIVLIGDCRGAKSIINFANTRPEKLKAVIAMTPFFSVRELTQSLARNYLKYLPFGDAILHRFFKTWFPNYKEENDQFLTALYGIDPTIPILIGHRAGDTLVTDEQIAQLIKTLHLNGTQNAHLLISHDKSAPHSKLSEVQSFQEGVNLFLQLNNLPHNPELARRGRHYLTSTPALSIVNNSLQHDPQSKESIKKANYFLPVCATHWKETLALHYSQIMRLLSAHYPQFNAAVGLLFFS